jgi:rubrerythrin
VTEKLENSRTFQNLKKAFGEEAALVFRYLYYAALAEFEGLDRHAKLFKELGEGGHTAAQGVFDYLKRAGDPDTGLAVGGTAKNIESLAQTETRQFSQTYPEMARTAREEGFPDVAAWFDTLEKLKRSRVRKLGKLK